jgi:two-component system chemotaxis response regulator CheB
MACPTQAGPQVPRYLESEAVDEGPPQESGRRGIERRNRDIVVVGASAGGLEALVEVVAGLPPDFPASVLIVLHVRATGTSVLDTILTRTGNLLAISPADREPVARGKIYVAPRDQHMLLKCGFIALSRGPRENGHRPAIDPLFRSAARSAGPRAIGVILSGALDDGTAGLRFLKERGGRAIVQDPADALHRSMPEHALAGVDVDHIIPASAIAAVIRQEVERPVDKALSDEWESMREPDLVEVDPLDFALMAGPPTGLTCAQCHGALWEEVDGSVPRFTCHIGHSYSPESLVSEQSQALESALWSGLRACEERADLLLRLARRTTLSTRSARRFRTRARDAHEQADVLRVLLAQLWREVPSRDLTAVGTEP